MSAQPNPTLTFSRTTEIPIIDLLEKLAEKEVNLIYSPTLIPSITIKLKKGTYSIAELSILLEEKGVRLIQQGSSYLVSLIEKDTHTLSGYVKSKESGENLIGAVLIVDDGETGTVTNNYGFFSLQLKKGAHKVITHYIGYSDVEDSIWIDQPRKVEILLHPKRESLEEVIVTDFSSKEWVLEQPPGMHQLNYRKKGLIPYFLGEIDVLQESLLLPGITSLGEDASGINIRGGDIDQNLYLLDEATIYNPNHFYGLISVFNPEAVSDVRVMKGYIPPSFGGRASSVISIYQREGNMNQYNFSGGIGLVSARATVEGPIVKGKSSFLISGRQSLLDLSLEDDTPNENSRTSFQDLNAKFNWRLDEKNTFFLSGYIGNDRNRAGFDAVRNWGNKAITARWNHTFTPKLFSHFSGVLSEYDYRITNPVEAGSFIGRSQIINYGFKSSNHYYLNPDSHFEFGLNATYHILRPGERIPFDENSSQKEPLILDDQQGVESSLYIQHNQKLTSWLEINYGFRLNHLITIGEEEFYQYDPTMPRSDFTIIDTIQFKNGEKVYDFIALEPRVSFLFNIGENIAIKPAYVRMHQFLHLISNTAAPSPTDIWKLSGRYIPPVKTDQYSLGFYHYLSKKKWEISIEGYFKEISNILDYKNNADLLFNPNLETEILVGDGRAYGMELFIRKRTGRFTGWLSYTLSRAERQLESPFPEEQINDGEYFPEDFDKTHDLSLVGVFNINQRLSVSASFNYNSGRPITLPSGKYTFNGTLVPHFEDRNRNRLSDYHRLDLSARLNGKSVRKNGKKRINQDYWTFSVYNVYARENVYSYFFTENEDNPEITELEEFSIFGTIIPSITYNFKF